MLETRLRNLGASGLSTSIPTGTTLQWGTVIVQHDDGSFTLHKPTSDSDSERGTTLNTAMQSVAAGETLIIGPGTYLMDTGSTHYKWTMPTGSTVVGAGRSTVIKATQAGGLATTGIIMPGLNTMIKDLFFDTSAGNGSNLIFPIGRNSDTGSAYNVKVYILNVGFDSGTDGIYFEDGASANQLEVYACGLYGNSAWDYIVLSPSGVGASFIGKFWNCQVSITNSGNHVGFSSAFFRSFTDFGTTDFEFYSCDVTLAAASGSTICFNGGGDAVPTIKVRGGRYTKGSGSTAFFNTGLTASYDGDAQWSSVPTNATRMSIWASEITDNGTNIMFSRTIAPVANDTAALGTASLRFSDIFMASGAVINGAGPLTFVPGTVSVMNNSGMTTYYLPPVNSDSGRGVAFRSAIMAHNTNDTIVVGPGTYSLSTAITLKTGVSLVGIGGPTFTDTTLTEPLFRIINNNILLQNIKITPNSCGFGVYSSTSQVATGLMFRNVEVTPGNTSSNAVMWSQNDGGGSTAHKIEGKFYNCLFSSGSTSGFGAYAFLNSSGNLNLFDCDIFGATDGVLFSNSGNSLHIGGQYRSILDAMTSGVGHLMKIVGCRARGDQADLYGDDGSIEAYWVDARTQSIVGNGITYNDSNTVGSVVTINGQMKWCPTGGSPDTGISRVSAAVLRVTDAASNTGNLEVLDQAYSGSWNASIQVPTKNAVYDKIQAMIAGSTGTVDNALLRADGSGGLTVQASSSATLDDIGTLKIYVNNSQNGTLRLIQSSNVLNTPVMEFTGSNNVVMAEGTQGGTGTIPVVGPEFGGSMHITSYVKCRMNGVDNPAGLGPTLHYGFFIPIMQEECFTSDTIINTPSGYKKIDDLREGDDVYSMEPETGVIVENNVDKILDHQYRSGYVLINGSIKVTSNHPLWSNGRYVRVSDLKVGDWVKNIRGEKSWIFSLEEVNEECKIFNLIMKNKNFPNYFAHDILAHNKCPFIYYFDKDNKYPWVYQTTFLVEQNSKEKESVGKWKLKTNSSKFYIREIEPETSYIKNLSIIADGERFSWINRPIGEYVVLKQGDILAVDFEQIPENTQELYIESEGYYLED